MMTASARLTLSALSLALAAALSAAPASAQNSVQNSAQPAPAPASNGVIGPSELENFSLPGTVTRTAPPASQPATPPQPQPRQPSTEPTPQQSSAQPPQQAQPQPQTSAPATTPRADTPADSSVTFDLPPPQSTASPPVTGAAPGFGSQPAFEPSAPPPSASIPLDDGPTLWPWLLAALAAAGASLYYAMRKRSQRLATAGTMPFDAPAPVSPPPPVRQPPPRAVPPAPAPASTRDAGMIVSTGLRPQLDIQFVPERLVVDTGQTALQFSVTLVNSGNAPARDVLLEAAMFNAGATQDQEIAAFFAHPNGRGERIPEILPLKGVPLRSQVVLPTAQLRVFHVDGRKLFVPLIGFNALYRSGGRDAQVSESFVLGVDTQSEKMGPFRIDEVPRQFRRLAARPHSARLRK